MKAKILFVFMLFIGINLNAQTTFEKILNALAGLNGGFLEVTTKVVEVNSTMKFNGISKQTINIQLPAGTIKWYYRITVLPVSSSYAYQSNETLLYLLQNKMSMEIYSPTRSDNDNINFYLFGHSGDVDSFLTGKDFKILKGSHENINSFIDVDSDLVNLENLWIGIENPNKIHGLKVIIEVVAFGHFN